MFGTTPLVCVARVDNATVRFQGLDFMFAKKGIYVTCYRFEQAGLNYYILQGITLPNYNFTKEVVKPIDEKFLPDTVARVEDISKAIFGAMEASY